MRVSVNPINSINVRVNQGNPSTVTGTSTFVGSTSSQAQIQVALDTANNALAVATTANNNVTVAYNYANSAFAEANTLATQIDGGTY